MHLKRYSAFLTVMEVKIKITFRYHFTSVSVVIIKKKVVTNSNEDSGKEENLHNLGGSVH